MSRKKRILLFIKTPPPFHGASIANKYVKDSSILQKNFDIEVIDSHYSKDIKEIGLFRFSKLIRISINIFKLNYLLLFFRPEVVYFQLSHRGIGFMRDFVFIAMIKLYRVKMVYHLQGKGIEEITKRSGLKRVMFRYAFKNENIISLSEKLSTDVKQVYDQDVFVVPNCAPDFNRVKIKNNNSKTLRLIFVSNLIESKGVLDVIRAVGILLDRGYKLYLDIVGGAGDLKEADLIKNIEENKAVQFVKYLGPKFDSDKIDLLINSDVFVFPTYYANEAFPLSIVEAMDVGLPVITTDEGGIGDLVEDGKNGFIVPPRSPEAVADKLEILINDIKLRVSMGLAGREKYLNKYTLDKFEKNILTVFNNVFLEKNIR